MALPRMIHSFLALEFNEKHSTLVTKRHILVTFNINGFAKYLRCPISVSSKDFYFCHEQVSL